MPTLKNGKKNGLKEVVITKCVSPFHPESLLPQNEIFINQLIE